MATVAERFASRYAGASVIAVTHVTPVKALVAQALGRPGGPVPDGAVLRLLLPDQLHRRGSLRTAAERHLTPALVVHRLLIVRVAANGVID